ncbi:Uncharacterised protein [Mycobacteroides abscessus subsp. abscessus]|nr:Uncharacterised protein [Mycobacteroides abscessus subsp. abscessus]SKD11170.1 Uncharacterised protein [Mycobacteroides abscessus subsp. abscessus]SKL37735.1 Uncharacterised protein [Mycobacteroides abscessus subsp. abscessus]SKM28198.1 Uncharacterised protein [Mycobacteroides abscessus subsp. abscessus]
MLAENTKLQLRNRQRVKQPSRFVITTYSCEKVGRESIWVAAPVQVRDEVN